MTHHSACACWRCCAERDRIEALTRENPLDTPLQERATFYPGATLKLTNAQRAALAKDGLKVWHQSQNAAEFDAGFNAGREPVDEGSAAHEPAEGIGIAEEKVRLGIAAWTKIYNGGGFDPLAVWRNEQNEQRLRLTAQAEQIGALMCRVEQLEREKEAMRESRDYWQAMAARADQMRGAMQKAGVE